jgi:hypothetical protein
MSQPSAKANSAASGKPSFPETMKTIWLNSLRHIDIIWAAVTLTRILH